jgi:hypothetical protein
MQADAEDLKSELKRLENEKIMSTKDHETERALLKSHIDNLEKQASSKMSVKMSSSYASVDSEGALLKSHMHSTCNVEKQVYLLYSYKLYGVLILPQDAAAQLKNRDVLLRDGSSAQFTCFTSTKVQVLTRSREAAEGPRRFATRS